MRRGLVIAALTLLALPAPANAQHPWDGNPISRGLGPTYGEQWCEPPRPGSGEARQQGPPLAVIPGEAIGCTLDRFQDEARAAEIPRRMSYSVIGRSVQGRPLYGVVVNAVETPQQRRDYARWRELRATMLTKPELAQSQLDRWGTDVKLPIFVESNIHGNEEEGTDAIMQVIRDLVTTPRGADPAVDALLDHAFLIVHPTINPDGRSAETRANANGFDLNRDLLEQGQPETRTSIADMLGWLPPVGLTMHGYVNPTQAQAMTKPHNPGYEYDLLLRWNQRRIDANEEDLAAVGMATLRPVNDWCANADEPPAGGLCEGGFPPGPAVAEGWDDWGPFYVAGHASVWALDIQTIEMCSTGPGCDGRFGSKRAQYVSFYSSADFWIEHRNAILRDQVEIYRRGVADEERVSCCDDPLIASRGFAEDQHDWMVEYPKAYVIPFDGASPSADAQRSDAEANRLVRWLLDNGVVVERARRSFTWGGKTYPKHSYVVWMDQAFRGLALTVLSAGQDISDRIARLYAPPGAWSRGLIWGADVVEIPRADPTFDPRTSPISGPNDLRGGVPAGRAEWYAVTLRGPSEVRAVLDVLRRGVDAELAEATGSLLFPTDRRTVAALEAAKLPVERGRGPKPRATELTRAPRIAVLVASTAMNDTLWSLRQIFGEDAEFVSVVDIQNAPTDPLLDFDVIYNAGQDYPAAEHATARARLRAFFERGGGYIGTSQSPNNFAFLNNAALLNGSLTQGSQPAGGGIAKWTNLGAEGPLTGAYSAEDYLYLPTNVTYFTSVPTDAAVDGRYLGTTTDLFVAGLWRDRRDAAAGAPVIVHGETTVGSRYLALATNPFSRGDAEREWTLIGQAALWAGADVTPRPAAFRAASAAATCPACPPRAR